MPKNTKIILLIIAALFIGLLAWGLRSEPGNIKEEQTQNLLKYENQRLGFSFEYPNTYTVEERDLSTGNRYQISLVLLPVGYVPPEGGEGPPTINVDIYQNDLDRQSVESWIKGSASSNYKLGDGILTPVNISGVSGLSYNWDGLYNGRTIAFEHEGNIITVSESFMNPADEIRNNFQIVIDSFILFPASNVTGGKLPQTLLENYLKENISRISPEKEVLGGKFYLTEVKLNDGGSGIVSYEDGHVAFTADFTYRISTWGNVVIDTFIIRK